MDLTLSGTVMLVSAGLVGLSVWLVSRPQPLSVTVKAPTGVNNDAEGLLVDLDPLDVQWQSQGIPETVAVFLENVDTGAQSGKRTTAADVRDAVFSPSEVHQVATDRGYRHRNRIRSVVEGKSYIATR